MAIINAAEFWKIMKRLIEQLSKSFNDIRRCGILFLLCVGMFGNGEVQGRPSGNGSPAEGFAPAKNGRDFDRISIHPNSEDWLFTECSHELNPAGDCLVLRYNLKTQQLQRYQLPDGYLYSYASFSPQGHYIVINRAPKHDGSETQIQQSIENAEIVVMRSNGTDFRVLPLAKGSKLAPFMSLDETKIAYWRPGVLRSPGGKTMSTDFDVYEYDLKSQSDSLFSGRYQFFEAGNAQYISADEILLSSYGPRKYAQSMGDYQKKYNGSEVYKLKRNNPDLPVPSFTEIEHARDSSADNQGNTYFSGQKLPSPGASFFKRSPAGDITLWQQPLNLIALRHVVAAPDGRYIAFIYASEGSRYRDQKSAFGRLDTGTPQWLPIDMPALAASTLLPVRPATD